MVQKSQGQPPGMYKNPANNGINYSTGSSTGRRILNHQQVMVEKYWRILVDTRYGDFFWHQVYEDCKPLGSWEMFEKYCGLSKTNRKVMWCLLDFGTINSCPNCFVKKKVLGLTHLIFQWTKISMYHDLKRRVYTMIYIYIAWSIFQMIWVIYPLRDLYLQEGSGSWRKDCQLSQGDPEHKLHRRSSSISEASPEKREGPFEPKNTMLFGLQLLSDDTPFHESLSFFIFLRHLFSSSLLFEWSKLVCQHIMPSFTLPAKI